MDSLNKQAKLSSRVRRDLVERSTSGIWAHPVCMLLVFFTSHLHERARGLMVVAVGMAFVLAAARWFVTCRFWRESAEREKVWHRRHVALLLATAGLWGLVCGSVLGRFGYQDSDVLTQLLYHAVITFGMINVLVHDRRTMVASLALLMLPLLVGDFASGSRHPVSCMFAAIAFFSYCMMQGFKQNKLYEQQISDNYELSVAAYQDHLTGLPNRLFLEEALQGSIVTARESRTSVALLYIDLDGFKQINDCYSHKVGDAFLVEAAARIRAAVRRDDTAARVGGDEFTVLLPRCASADEAIDVAHRVLLSARQPVLVDGHMLHYSASIGVSLFPEQATTAELLVRSADEAMYAAKTSGKDRVCFSTTAGVLHLPLSATPLAPRRVLEGGELCLGMA